MGKKDVSSIDYLEDSSRIADFINGYCFHGRQIIRPEQVHEKNRSNSMPLTVNKNKVNKDVTIYRDVIREIQISEECKMQTIIFAIESQSEIHYAMPLKVMVGDCANYYRQWKHKEKEHLRKKDLQTDEFISGFAKDDKLTPIVTVVLYFGDEPWNGPRCLKDILDMNKVPEEIKPFVVDYPIEIVEVKRYADYELFRTDLRLVFGFLRRDSDTEVLVDYIHENSEDFEAFPADACRLLGEFANIKGTLFSNIDKQGKRGVVNVCKAIDDLQKNSFKKGQEAEKAKTIKERERADRETERADRETERADRETERADRETERADRETERADREKERADKAERELEELKRMYA